MISEKESETKVKKYANENNYTILANTFGTLEYVKYDYTAGRVTKFLKWPKGSDSISISVNNETTKIKLSDIRDD